MAPPQSSRIAARIRRHLREIAIRFSGLPMTQKLIEQSRSRPAFADLAYLATTVALAVSVAFAFSVVTFGIARAAM
jgi:hypothetical protein